MNLNAKHVEPGSVLYKHVFLPPIEESERLHTTPKKIKHIQKMVVQL